MKMGMSRLLIALAAVAAGGAIYAAAGRYTPVQENAGRETVELNLLMSLGGDGLREDYMRERLAAYEAANPDVRVIPTFVESDTLAFLKLLYAGKGYHYDVVCMGDDSMLSAAEQRLIYPMDEFVMGHLGLAWLDAVPGACLENTMSGGKIYGLPFIKSRLKVYYRDGGDGENAASAADRAGKGGEAGGNGGAGGNGAAVVYGAGKSGGIGGNGAAGAGGAGKIPTPVSLEALLKASGGKRLGLPVSVLLRDLLLSTDSSGWDALLGETERYQVDRPERAALLRAMKAGLERGTLVDGDNQTLMEEFAAGRLDAVVLEEIYREELERRAGETLSGAGLWRTEQTPWLLQGCNLYLANRGIPHDYGPAWELVEYLVRDGEFDARTGEERDMDYKRTLSRKNTKAYLIVDRMIAEFLHGDEDCGELLKGLQSQLDTALGE
ncbi:extracellular solute-binding protein [Enterocloster lavalensis]|uniref:extracellular solute-binding protein n=1 Tax=Enterocloster lavalensis TaxID=460384 RepID=UPI0023F04921|nr:extracellular solute-binding protein [Enterocloster lavalensis]